MEGTQADIQKALADMNWEERLKEARARREAILRAKAAEESAKGSKPIGLRKIGDFGGFVEEPKRPRLAAVDTPVSGSSDGGPKAVAPRTAQKAPPLLLVTETSVAPETTAEPPVAEPRLATQPAKKRIALVGLVFCAGIGVGTGIMVVLNQVMPPAASGVEQIVSRAPDQRIMPAETAPIVQAIGAPTTVLPVAEGPVLLAVLGDQFVPPALPAAAGIQGLRAGATTSPLDGFSFGAPLVGALPDFGASPQPAVFATTAPNRAEALTIDVTSAPSMLVSLEAIKADIGTIEQMAMDGAFGPVDAKIDLLPGRRTLPVAAGPAPVDLGDLVSGRNLPDLVASLTPFANVTAFDPNAGITLASLDDDIPALAAQDTLKATPWPGTVPMANLTPPEPSIPGAADLEMWIFAPARVDEGVVASAQALLEGFNLPVQDVYRVPFRVSETHIRYYDAASEAAAVKLAAELGGVPRDFTNSGANPPPGTLEVYLEGRGGGASGSSGGSQAIDPERLRQSIISKLRSQISE